MQQHHKGRSTIPTQPRNQVLVHQKQKLNEIPPRLDNDRTPHGYINQMLQIQFGAPDDDPLKTC
jgi:hypothetical protein